MKTYTSLHMQHTSNKCRAQNNQRPFVQQLTHKDSEDDYNQSIPDFCTKTGIWYCCGGDDCPVCQRYYQQYQYDHDLAQQFQKLAKLENVAISTLGHLHVFLVKLCRHVSRYNSLGVDLARLERQHVAYRTQGLVVVNNK